MWNDGFHAINKHPKEVFALKSSGINVYQELPLKDRLNRFVSCSRHSFLPFFLSFLPFPSLPPSFLSSSLSPSLLLRATCYGDIDSLAVGVTFLDRFAKMSVAEKQLMPTCQERQLDDLVEMAGGKIVAAKSVPVRGQPLYFDPLDNQLIDVKRHREKLVRQREARLREKEYKEAVKTIPHVTYHAIQDVTSRLARADSFQSSLAQPSTHSSKGFGSRYSNSSFRTAVSEQDLDAVVSEGLDMDGLAKAKKAAARGDTEALHKYFMDVERAVSVSGKAQLHSQAISSDSPTKASTKLASSTRSVKGKDKDKNKGVSGRGHVEEDEVFGEDDVDAVHIPTQADFYADYNAALHAGDIVAEDDEEGEGW